MAALIEKTYAKAIYSIAEDQKSQEQILNELSVIDEVFSNNPEYVKILNLPSISTEEKHNVLSTVFKDKISDCVFKFLLVLIDKNRISYFHRIVSEYRNMYYYNFGILEVKVTTSVPLSEGMRKKLIDKLTATSKKNIILKETVDENIIGGIVLKYGNTLLDASLKNRLDSMRAQINSIIA